MSVTRLLAASEITRRSIRLVTMSLISGDTMSSCFGGGGGNTKDVKVEDIIKFFQSWSSSMVSSVSEDDDVERNNDVWTFIVGFVDSVNQI